MEIIKEFGLIAGLAGLAIGLVLYLFRNIISKTVLDKLSVNQAYRMIIFFMALVWTLSIYAIYVYSTAPNDPVPTRTSLSCAQWKSNLEIIESTYQGLGSNGKTYINKFQTLQKIQNLEFPNESSLVKDKEKLITSILSAPSFPDPYYNVEFTELAKSLRNQLKIDILKEVNKCN
jgi:hypothetical protein